MAAHVRNNKYRKPRSQSAHVSSSREMYGPSNSQSPDHSQEDDQTDAAEMGSSQAAARSSGIGALVGRLDVQYELQKGRHERALAHDDTSPGSPPRTLRIPADKLRPPHIDTSHASIGGVGSQYTTFCDGTHVGGSSSDHSGEDVDEAGSDRDASPGVRQNWKYFTSVIQIKTKKILNYIFSSILILSQVQFLIQTFALDSRRCGRGL